jgi:hypothetical protein
MKIEENEKIGKLWFEDMWSTPDFEIAERIIAPDYKPDWIHINAVGPELVKREIEHFRSIFPDLSQKIIEIKGEERKVWVRYKAHATHKGDAWGFNPSNKETVFEAAAILYINKEGKVYDMWESYCFYDILTDLGLVPPFWDLHKYFLNYIRDSI